MMAFGWAIPILRKNFILYVKQIPGSNSKISKKLAVTAALGENTIAITVF